MPFRGDGDLMGQLIGGHVDFASVTLASAAAAGPSVRVIGIFADARNPILPDAPTVKEQGYDVAPTSFGGLFAPAGTPADVIGKLGDGCQLRRSSSRATSISPSGCIRARATTPTPRPSRSGSRRTSTDKKQLLQRVGLIK